jgi:hypothetical protein
VPLSALVRGSAAVCRWRSAKLFHVHAMQYSYWRHGPAYASDRIVERHPGVQDGVDPGDILMKLVCDLGHAPRFTRSRKTHGSVPSVPACSLPSSYTKPGSGVISAGDRDRNIALSAAWSKGQPSTYAEGRLQTPRTNQTPYCRARGPPGWCSLLTRTPQHPEVLLLRQIQTVSTTNRDSTPDM